jgi:oleate hydratase
MKDETQSGLYYMIGGGISALSAAYLLLREAGVPGNHIRILDDQPHAGGALDGAGEETWGFLTRGGRMFEPNFVNTLDLFAHIPSADDPKISVTEDTLAFNAEVRASSRCRLVANGQNAHTDDLGLSPADILAINRLVLTPENRLADRRIDEWFDDDFFDTAFWIMWASMFSFQPWHSVVEMRRYMNRFLHLFPGLTRIEGVLRTRFNQYDSLIAPLVDWLKLHGVRFDLCTKVTGLDITEDAAGRSVRAIHLQDGQRIDVQDRDKVFITLGSMTDGATYGTNTMAPPLQSPPCPSWDLWRLLARSQDGFGRPETFCGDVSRTGWTSFTVTMDDPAFAEFQEAFSGNKTGTGGLVTIRDSAWLLSYVMFAQPHFRAQPEQSVVFWGYGLRGDRDGDFVKKPMQEATGDEVLSELCGHLRLTEEQSAWFKDARVVPCRMPYITSQFMPRQDGDRPATRPEGARNFALMGQFVELPRDTVFTVEYSVRSARAAVQALTGRAAPLPIVRSDKEPRVLLRAARTLVGL